MIAAVLFDLNDVPPVSVASPVSAPPPERRCASTTTSAMSRALSAGLIGHLFHVAAALAAALEDLGLTLG